MNLSLMANRAAKMVSDNSPAILTAVGVVGTITTAVLTGKAAFKAAQILDDEETRIIRDSEEPLNPREKLYFTWKLFIPPAVTAATTIVCIIAANRIEARRASALIAAYALGEKAFEEYKAKIVEKLGDRKELAVRDEIAQDRITRNPPPPEMMAWDETSNSVLCCDQFTGRYFLSDVESIRRAENDVNFQIIGSNYASLSDFYDRIGLDRTSMSDDFGWNVDKPLNVHISTAMTPMGRPCITFDFTVLPIRGFARVQ